MNIYSPEPGVGGGGGLHLPPPRSPARLSLQLGQLRNATSEPAQRASIPSRGGRRRLCAERGAPPRAEGVEERWARGFERLLGRGSGFGGVGFRGCPGSPAVTTPIHPSIQAGVPQGCCGAGRLSHACQTCVCAEFTRKHLPCPWGFWAMLFSRSQHPVSARAPRGTTPTGAREPPAPPLLVGRGRDPT